MWKPLNPLETGHKKEGGSKSKAATPVPWRATASSSSSSSASATAASVGGEVERTLAENEERFRRKLGSLHSEIAREKHVATWQQHRSDWFSESAQLAAAAKQLQQDLIRHMEEAVRKTQTLYETEDQVVLIPAEPRQRRKNLKNDESSRAAAGADGAGKGEPHRRVKRVAFAGGGGEEDDGEGGNDDDDESSSSCSSSRDGGVVRTKVVSGVVDDFALTLRGELAPLDEGGGAGPGSAPLAGVRARVMPYVSRAQALVARVRQLANQQHKQQHQPPLQQRAASRESQSQQEDRRQRQQSQQQQQGRQHRRPLHPHPQQQQQQRTDKDSSDNNNNAEANSRRGRRLSEGSALVAVKSSPSATATTSTTHSRTPTNAGSSSSSAFASAAVDAKDEEALRAVAEAAQRAIAVAKDCLEVCLDLHFLIFFISFRFFLALALHTKHAHAVSVVCLMH